MPYHLQQNPNEIPVSDAQFAEEANFQNCVRIAVKAVGHTQESPKEPILRTTGPKMA